MAAKRVMGKHTRTLTSATLMLVPPLGSIQFTCQSYQRNPEQVPIRALSAIPQISHRWLDGGGDVAEDAMGR